ncbi:titin-like [Harpegnathos saltator]|uniref:titin-like n=1 Tax=Harpegnathos saltator TaxID=610380 RepID=UPI000DBED676|nr:titin-like [Harpegnathos saltator]
MTDTPPDPGKSGDKERGKTRPVSPPTREEMQVVTATSRSQDTTIPMEEEPKQQRGKRRRTAMEAALPKASMAKASTGEESAMPERSDKVRRVKTPPPTILDGELEDAPPPTPPDTLPPSYSREEGEVEIGNPKVGTSIAPTEEVADTIQAPVEVAATMAKDRSEETGTASSPPEIPPSGTEGERPEEA